MVRMLTFGAAERTATASREQAARTCSQPSSRRRLEWVARWSQRSDNDSPARSCGTPTAFATAMATSSGSASTDRSTDHTPSGQRGASSSPSSRASRLFPTPPGPAIVTRRYRSTMSVTTAKVSGSADEQVQGPDEVVAIGGEGTDRWELGSPRDIHLEEPDRVVEVPEAVAAGIVERDDHVCGEPADRVRGHQHLATVARSADARRLVHRHRHVAVCARVGQATVHAHAHSDPSFGGPGLPLERRLAFGAGEHGLAGVAEGDEERVTLGADLEATMRDPAGPQERPVPLEEGRIRVTEAVQQAGRALDVGEHERHVPRRQPTPCMLHLLHHPRQACRCRRRSLLMPRTSRPRSPARQLTHPPSSSLI